MATGINVDIYHPHTPTVGDLNGVTYLRTVLNMSRKVGAEDYNRTIQDYKSFFNPFIQAGKKVILVVNHETWGENKNLPLSDPNYDWRNFTDMWIPKLIPLIAAFDNPNYIWQCFNEVDNASEAAYGIHPFQYDYMYRRFRNLVKSYRNQLVITSGLVSGPGDAIAYARDARLNAADVDAIAFHSYGRVAKLGPQKYNQYGFIEDEIAEWRRFTSKRLFNTEFGLARLNESENDVAQMVKNWVDVTELHNIDSCFFAWGIGQHNTFNIEGDNGFMRNNLLNSLRRGSTTTPKPTGNYVEQFFSGDTPRFRSSPSVNADIISGTYGRMFVDEIANGIEADGYIWRKARNANNQEGWFALVKGLVRKNL